MPLKGVQTMSDQRIEIKCPRCQHQWWADLNDMPSLPVYRGDAPAGKPREYRLLCPACGNRFVATVTDDEEGVAP
jgi:Zn finger protein HypA/HybF involved in hydrogenase expression